VKIKINLNYFSKFFLLFSNHSLIHFHLFSNNTNKREGNREENGDADEENPSQDNQHPSSNAQEEECEEPSVPFPYIVSHQLQYALLLEGLIHISHNNQPPPINQSNYEVGNEDEEKEEDLIYANILEQQNPSSEPIQATNISSSTSLMAHDHIPISTLTSIIAKGICDRFHFIKHEEQAMKLGSF